MGLCEARYVFGEDRWNIQECTINLFLTKNGGHMAPVYFGFPRKTNSKKDNRVNK